MERYWCNRVKSNFSHILGRESRAVRISSVSLSSPYLAGPLRPAATGLPGSLS